MIKAQTTDPEEILLSILDASRKSLRHFAFFVVGAMTHWEAFLHEEDDEGNRIAPVYDENWHLVLWYQLMEECYRLCVLCARGFGKTRAFSWTYPLWRTWRDPGTRGLLASDTVAQAAENLDLIKKIIENNEVLAALKPPRPQRWGYEAIRCTNESVLEVTGAGASIRGRHPDYGVLDDILSEANCNTADQRKKIERWMTNVIEPMFLGNRPLFVVGTPQSYDDPLMKLAKNKEYRWYRFPAELTDDEYETLRGLLHGGNEIVVA